MIRVLVAEDSPTFRELLVEILGSDPEIEVIGQAVNGLEAVAMTRKLQPDLVAMDIRMPEMDGFDATKQIMIETPTPIVLISGHVRVQDAESSMHALRLGALWVLEKPPGPESPEFERAAREVIHMVKAMSQVKVVRHRHTRPHGRRRSPRGAPARRTRPRLRAVAMAASCGGPEALSELLLAMPGDFAVPILVVQHISIGFIGGLAASLNDVSYLRVKVGEEGEPITPGTVYLAADDLHLGVSREGRVLLSKEPPIEGFRPSGTHLLQSVAAAYGSASVGVVLTGMGEDGVEGLRAIHQAGGRTIAQDEESSVVFGMPGAAVAAGIVDEVLPITELSKRLMELVKNGN